ncbi:hypothetical protein M758_UG271500 [Ceratodon purpureus]|nr:hypothetical protein M758_UG271500 [Ceratodon purpureus]
MRAAALPPPTHADGTPFLIPGLSDTIVESVLLPWILYLLGPQDILSLSQVNTQWHEVIGGTQELTLIKGLRRHQHVLLRLRDPPRVRVSYIAYLYEVQAEMYGVLRVERLNLGILEPRYF